MQRMLVLWSLFLGLALVGADAYLERGNASAVPSYEGGTMASPQQPDLWEDGTPIPPPK
jgi:hypothetical protein